MVMDRIVRDTGGSMLWSPPKWRTQALRDEDVKAAKRLTTQLSDTQIDGYTRPLELVELEVAEDLHMDLEMRREGEILHGSGWQDPICRLFQSEKEWQDPICTLFQTKTPSVLEAGESCYSNMGLIRGEAPNPNPQNVTDRSPDHRQENLFRDMGFPLSLIQRAIQIHGAEAEDSIILQYLLGSKHVDHSRETKATDENYVSSSFTVCQQIANSMTKNGAEELWDNDYSDSDCDKDEEEVILPTSRPPIDWTEERGSDHPVMQLCKRELPDGDGHRLLMSNHGFPAELVERAIQELGEGVEYDMILEYLLYLTAQQDPKPSTSASCEKRASTVNKPVIDYCYPTKQQAGYKKQVNTVEKLVAECGYPAKGVERAVAICDTPLWDAKQDQIADLVDFLTAHGGELNESEDDAKEDEREHPQEDTDWSWLQQHVEEDGNASSKGKRKFGHVGVARRKTINRLSRPPQHVAEDGRARSKGKQKSAGYGGVARRKAIDRPSNLKQEQFDNPPQNRPRTVPLVQLAPQQRSSPAGSRSAARLPQNITKVEAVSKTVDRHHGSVGFGLPGCPVQPRYLDEDVKGAPFFYFENAASMPNEEWDRIRRHLFDIEPEFVDSMHFSACRRPRGYIHNLPIEGRRKILADPPMTIQELLPHTKPFWPGWDHRTKLNCITSRMRSNFLINKLQIGDHGTSLQTADQQSEILQLCRHWNLVWTAPNIPTPIDEVEIEAMLGFDAGHSRNIVSNRSRYKALGNSVSVHTVAFHFSVLKPLYPRGMKVLSLFSGIGGAEVALHKMGIKLLVVVSVELDDGTRRCLEEWWAASKQTGVLNQKYHNIKDLGRAQISELVNMYGGFDLIVGGTPCNILSGSSHVTRVGLEVKQSTVFFEFSRVVTAVRELTIRLHQKK